MLLFFISIILIAISGRSEAVMDKLLFHFNNSIFKFKKNQNYWNPNLSWVNKYKPDLKTPKFFGSTNIFVFLTDAWHFHKFIRTTLMFISLGLLSFINASILCTIFMVFICRIVYGISFTYCFSNFSLKNNI